MTYGKMTCDGVGRSLAISGILTSLGGLLQVVGLATPYWATYGETKVGLYILCGKTNDGPLIPSVSVCGSFTNPEGWRVAARAFETIGILILGACFLVILLKCCCLKDKRILLVVIFIAQFAAGGTIIVGVIIFGANKFSPFDFGFSFYLCIVAAVFSLLAGVFTFLEYRKNPMEG